MASQQSPWHSLVLYLFEGLALMLGIIGFALLILACSYWKLSCNSRNTQRDEENRVKQRRAMEKGHNNAVEVYEEKTMVIMIGNKTLSSPRLSSKGPSFGDSQGNNNGDGQSFVAKDEKEDNFDKTKAVNNINNDDDNDDDVGNHAVHGHN
ncbi:protein GLUTAMINE DUMPER 1-like [Syzygium oleosum]|uniref:protein GLUTAMINE DUMPER 1-like n=1 Tax=Syzygium oleosum TaxID=219896 RepID=UPI0024BBDAF6|nr:protein GLUTAMINE DUMPER 1-like [Syzygium oleosum]